MPELDNLVLEDAREAMKKSLDSLQRDVGRIRTGRANPAVLDGVQVDYHGTPTPLKALASLNAPEARLLTVQPFDPNALEGIEKAILKADLGLTPLNDGKILRVPVPELTEERRRELVKQVKRMGEEHKLGVRSARREAITTLKDLQQSGDISEDESHGMQRKVQELTDEFIDKTDRMIAAKEQEILRV